MLAERYSLEEVFQRAVRHHLCCQLIVNCVFAKPGNQVQTHHHK